MHYALGTKDAATQPYTTSAPSKTGAGTYYVWYKVVGDAAKAQALYIRKHGKRDFLKVHDRLHEKYDFQKTQEILGQDYKEGLQIPLAMGEESVLISAGEIRDFPGTQVILKVGRHLEKFRDKVRSVGKTAYLIENCGMENEKVYYGAESIPEDAGYFSTVIAKEKE